MGSYIEEHRERFGVEPICQTLEVSASAYYQRAKGERSARSLEDERLLALITEIHEANYCAYGYRRMWIALQRAGEQVGRGRVARLMGEAGIQGAKRRGRPWRTTTPDPVALRRPDLVQRDFTVPGPDRLWVGDFTYLRSWEGASFFSFVIDAFSRKVVGWQPASHMRTDLVLDALRMALGQREPGADFQLVAHTDRGSQYTSADYTQELNDHGVLASVGTVGDAYDNAMAESFVDTFKAELIADRVWRSRSQLELAVVEYVSWFNNERLHESLGDVSPAEFEALYVREGDQLTSLKMKIGSNKSPWNLVRLTPRRLWFLTERGANLALDAGGERRLKALAPEQAAGPLRAHTLAVNEVGISFLRAARERGDEFGRSLGGMR